MAPSTFRQTPLMLKCRINYGDAIVLENRTLHYHLPMDSSIDSNGAWKVLFARYLHAIVNHHLKFAVDLIIP